MTQWKVKATIERYEFAVIDAIDEAAAKAKMRRTMEEEYGDSAHEILISAERNPIYPLATCPSLCSACHEKQCGISGHHAAASYGEPLPQHLNNHVCSECF